jgi:predicted O-methyltransferase YrrM
VGEEVRVVNRRASLPGVETLFGASHAAPGEDPSSARPTADQDQLLEAVASARELTAGEDAGLLAARRAAVELAPPSPEVGTLLRWAVTAGQARTVVEIGSAGGVSGLWMLPALAEGGVLTSLEPDAEAHRAATRAFSAATGGSRVRSIHGDPTTLLSRLADGAYDLVLLQAEPESYPEHLTRIRELLRVGGTLVVRGVLPAGEHRRTLQRLLRLLSEDEGFSSSVLPVDDGVALATRLADDAG